MIMLAAVQQSIALYTHFLRVILVHLISRQTTRIKKVKLEVVFGERSYENADSVWKSILFSMMYMMKYVVFDVDNIPVKFCLYILDT